jgi:hypothetical protein
MLPAKACPGYIAVDTRQSVNDDSITELHALIGAWRMGDSSAIEYLYFVSTVTPGAPADPEMIPEVDSAVLSCHVALSG